MIKHFKKKHNEWKKYLIQEKIDDKMHEFEKFLEKNVDKLHNNFFNEIENSEARLKQKSIKQIVHILNYDLGIYDAEERIIIYLICWCIYNDILDN